MMILSRLSPFFRCSSRKGRGFTLVELAIVLAVASLMFAGLWRLMSSGSTQMRDQAAADQMRQLIAAVKGYLGTSSQGQQNLMKAGTGSGFGTTFEIKLNCGTDTVSGLSSSEFCNFRPDGFTAGTQNSYGQTYLVRVSRTDGKATNTGVDSYSFMILTSGGEAITDTSGGRISGLIGNDGGFLYSTSVCGTPVARWSCGAYGSWSQNITSHGYAVAQGVSGHLAARASVVNGTTADLWLARKLYPPGSTASDYNTISTDLYFSTATGADVFLGGNTIYGASNTGAWGGHIDRLRTITLRQDFNTVNQLSNDQGVVIFGCSEYDNDGNKLPPVGGIDACEQKPLQVNGDVAVSKGFTAKMINGSAFVYDTPTSDIRLKHNIKPLKHALDDLSRLKAISFLMKYSEKKKMGVLAQDVEKVYPWLVYSISDDYKAVDYMGLIGPLIGAVQELKAQNDTLREQLRDQAEAIKEIREGLSK